ncbi:MAG TPA: hypothetical protein VGE98_02905 [Thermoanaerobaculia bacterium]
MKKTIASLKLKKETIWTLNQGLDAVAGGKTALTGANSACGSCMATCTGVTGWCVG